MAIILFLCLIIKHLHTFSGIVIIYLLKWSHSELLYGAHWVEQLHVVTFYWHLLHNTHSGKKNCGHGMQFWPLSGCGLYWIHLFVFIQVSIFRYISLMHFLFL